MAKTKANEREFQGQVIAWIQKQISHGGLPFENATNDSTLYGLPTVRFPDVLLTLDFACQRPYCGWELKTPETDARDNTLLKNAVESPKSKGEVFCYVEHANCDYLAHARENHNNS